MTRLLDLREVVPEDITVVLPSSEELRIPGDPPMEIYVRMLDLQDRTMDMEERISELDRDNISAEDVRAVVDEQRAVLDSTFDPVFDLFAVLQPDLDRDRLRSALGVRSCAAVIGQVMSTYADRGVEPPERPTTGSRRSSRPGASARKRTKSPSSTSSRT
jgi:hypothetical protein